MKTKIYIILILSLLLTSCFSGDKTIEEQDKEYQESIEYMKEDGVLLEKEKVPEKKENNIINKEIEDKKIGSFCDEGMEYDPNSKTGCK